MKIKKCIANICTCFLLLLFVIHICPKQFLHSVCTHHKHTSIPKNQQHVSLVSSTTTTCMLDNVEVEAPFLCIQNCEVNLLIIEFKNVATTITDVFFCTSKSVNSLRGPPVYC